MIQVLFCGDGKSSRSRPGRASVVTERGCGCVSRPSASFFLFLTDDQQVAKRQNRSRRDVGIHAMRGGGVEERICEKQVAMTGMANSDEDETKMRSWGRGAHHSN